MNAPTLVSGDAKICHLQEEAAKLPQVELRTEHFFADGCYVRQLFQPAGVLVVGKRHKREHLVVIQSGKLAVVNGDKRDIFEAPAVIPSPAGSKRALLAITDTVYLNVHRTDNTNLDEIEAELVEADRAALFDSGNKLKPLQIEAEG
jgi:hypothetical protein